MKIFFILNDMKKDILNNPKNFFRILFSLKYKNSLLDNLIRQRLIFNYKVEFKDKYLDLSAIYFKFLLTENGLKNLEVIIKMLSEFLHLTHENINNETLFEQIKEINNKRFFKKKPVKRAYVNLKKFTKNFFLYGKNNFISGDGLIRNYNFTIMHQFIKNMTLANSQIYIGARSFRNFNKTFLYKILREEEKEIVSQNEVKGFDYNMFSKNTNKGKGKINKN